MTEKTLFAQALEKLPEERCAFLNEACRDDTELRQRVEQLLRSREEVGSFLAQSAEEDFDATVDISVNDQEKIKNRSAKLKKSPVDRAIPKEKTDDHEPPSVSVVVEPDGKRALYFGEYELQGEIARGAMGVVYRAEQKSLKRTVAIKMIRSTLLTNEVDVTRFKAEAEAAASLDHPNIVPIYEVGMHEDQHYFTMKLIEGGTLRDHMDRLQKNPKAAAKLMSTVAGAIHIAHQRGILHRDLKPGNILVDEDGEPHVTDFGLAKQMESNSSVTLSGQIMGTPQYMAPEQAEGGGVELTTAADVYGLGTIFYEIICGKLPHIGTSLMDTLRLVAEKEAAPPSKHNPNVDRDLETIAMKCLEKDPAKRYASAQGLKSDLDRWLRGEPIEARPVGNSEKLIKWMKRKPMHAAATVLGVLFLLTLGIGGPIAALHQAALKDEAEALAIRANEAEAIAVQEKDTARQALARSAISLTEAALREGNGLAMQAALEDVPKYMRDSTWDYLLDQSDTSFGHINTGAAITDVVAHPRLPHVFAVVDRSGQVAILNVRTGVRLLEFAVEPSNGAINCMAISPDGERLVIGSRAEPFDLAIHDARDGKKLLSWKAKKTLSLRFSPDGQSVLQSEFHQESAQINLWDASTGRLRWSAPGVSNTASFTADGQQILVTKNMELVLLSAHDGSLISACAGGNTTLGVLGTDGKLVLSSNLQGVIRGTGIKDGRTVFQIRTDDRPIQELAFTADGGRFISATTLNDGRHSIHLWNAKTGAPLRTLLGGVGDIWGSSVHPLSGELIVCGKETQVWKVGQDAQWTIPGKPRSALAFFGSNELVYVASMEGGYAVHNLDSMASEALWSTPDPGNYPDVSISADGHFAALAGYDRPTLLLRKNGSKIEQVANFPPAIGGRLVRLSPRGDRLVSYNREWWPETGSVSVVETKTGNQVAPLERLSFKKVSDFAWLSEERLLGLVTAQARRGSPDSEEKLVVWDVTTGKILQTATNPSPMDVLALSPDGKRFAEAGADKQVRIRDTATLTVLQEFRAHDGAIAALAWHPTKPILATGSEDLAIRLWDLSTGERLEELRLPIAAPHTLAFSPGGHRLGCASEDSTTRIWEPRSLRIEGVGTTDPDGTEIDENTWFSDPSSYRSL